MHGDGGTALRTAAFPHLIADAVFADPAHGHIPFPIGQGVDGDAVGRHEGGIEAQAEVADDTGGIFARVVFEEFLSAGEGDLVDVLVHLLSGHTDAVVRHADFTFFLVQGHRDGQLLAFHRAAHHAQLGDGVHAVGDDFTQKDVFIRIQPAFDDRHDVLGVNGDIALLHCLSFFGQGTVPPRKYLQIDYTE